MVMLRTVVSAGGVVVRCTRIRVRGESGQRVGAQHGAVPAAGGWWWRCSLGGRGGHEL